jgi:hypothetical protein
MLRRPLGRPKNRWEDDIRNMKKLKIKNWTGCIQDRKNWKLERGGTWRIKTNDELDKLIRHKNTINYIKAQRLSWFGHLHRMSEERMVKKVYKWKPMLRRH